MPTLAGAEGDPNLLESPWQTDEIIRAELFSVERLEQHAASLAEAQQSTARPPVRRSLNARLKNNEAVLLKVYRTVASAVGEGQAIPPAAEWFLDNYHLVEDQIRQIHEDLPAGFYRQLPKLAKGPFAGYPRVFGLAWAYVAHSDSRFEPATLRRFVRAYQTVAPLTIGELWAVAITLRIVLIENLRRIVELLIRNRRELRDADRVANQLLGVSGARIDPDALIKHHGRNEKFSAAFVVQVVKRLRDQDPRVTPALRWLEEQLTAQGATSDQMVHDEHQRQGASNVTVRNIITSMRLISDVNWPEFVEAVSLVDEALRSASDFAKMDFATRNLYRSAIEDLARRSRYSELEIARLTLEIAAASKDETARERDPGYHLIAGGRLAFERKVGYRVLLRDWPSRLNAALGPIGYIGGVVLVTALALVMPLSSLTSGGIAPIPLTVLAFLGLIPAIDLAVALVNRVVTRSIGATILPGLAFVEGIPAVQRTLVVVPTLLTTPDAVEALIERLEVHYLASVNGEIYFALLTDWMDAPTETTAGDGALLALASAGIARLNGQHAADAEDARFFLLHRRRVWSAGQQQWMGWERKRGKLHELNRLLRGAQDTTFSELGRTPVVPLGVRNVITLDGDTRLPRETARRLIGKLAHPLNQPQFERTTRRVVAGYAVLQPRVTPSLPIGREGSLFQRVFSSMTGIDSYSAAVSDVYQDLFGQGSYAGKGIYDVDAFEAALGGRVPEGSLLSHDLFEGVFASAGLVSDIEVVEEYPSRYDVAAARNHRWARGDWQLLPWILGRGDAERGDPGALPILGLWKMLDNLRRTLSAPSAVLALGAGWLLPLHAAGVWTAFILTTIALPPLLPVLAAISPRRPGVIARSHVRALVNDLQMALLQVLLVVTFLAHQAWLMTDAIGRTLWRLLISRRNLLEWVTAAQAQLSDRLDLRGIYRRMSASVVLAIIAPVLIAWQGSTAWWAALPLVLLWLAAPAIAQRISLSPLVAGRVAISPAERHAMRLVARRTWRFFETFVTTEDHMLPPDNFQEDPQPVIAHRTSPTNLGLYLLCVVSARDFGWLGTLEAVERLEATLKTMQGLQRFRGHFYNWYDTRDLRPLEPPYVSTVDSGNLAAHLITLANAAREWRATAYASAVTLAGIEDALHLTREALLALPALHRTQPVTRDQLAEALEKITAVLRNCTDSSTTLPIPWQQLANYAATLTDSAQALASERDDDFHHDLIFWATATQRALTSWHRDTAQTDERILALDARLRVVETAARALAVAMEFDFLLDPERKLLSIGYRATDGTLDPNCYDLLASEARLASFVAIAKNDVPARHWFRLGRAVTSVGHGAALISWSGSMFEYLMPSLVMRAPAGSLLEQTNRLIVRRQISYGAAHGVPWGISESAYHARDIELTYQYSNFGVPGLGLKRGLSENVVVAPYATGLAAMVDPRAATHNFARLAALGACGRYGFYEALDYTRTRLPEGAEVAIVRAFMAHHQGMTVIAIANVLFDGRMRAHFHAEPSVQATELLLQERTPRDVSVSHPRAEEVAAAADSLTTLLPDVRRLYTTLDPTPQTHLLSNGRYAVMLTSAGSGYSLWQDLAITRWREDVTRDDCGSYVFLRDVQRGNVWSAGFQPRGVEPDSYEVVFSEDRAEITRRDATLTTSLQVVVSPEDDAEVRRVSLVNYGTTSRDIDVTSYCELVLAPPAADLAHPAFSKLFVHTEYLPKVSALLASRRRRAATDSEVWVAHHAVVEGEILRPVSYETDRTRFVGRTREIADSLALMDGHELSNTVGTVLDPVFALRYRVRIPAGATVCVSFWTQVAASRAGVLDILDKHHDANGFGRAATLAWTQAQAQLLHLGVTAEEANLFQRLASHALYANAAMRPSAETIQRGGSTQDLLWSQGISGDLPLVLLRIDHLEDIAIVRQLLQAHEYWRLKQLAVDVVILNERDPSYVQDLQTALETAVRMSQSRPQMGMEAAKGSVYVLRADLISVATRALLSAVARLVFLSQRGSLLAQFERRVELPLTVALAPRRRTLAVAPPVPPPTAAPPADLEFFNGLGGFAADGREYKITLAAGQATPAPWINVIANPNFGFQVAAEGGGYTWSVNSRENQLTPWSNDPVTDRQGEVFYVRDEESGEFWTPTAAPIRHQAAPYVVRYGQGYSHFEHQAQGIALELLMYVPLDAPLKICRLTLRNLAPRRRQLSVTAYVEWVLGTSRGASASTVVTEIDPVSGALFARNPWSLIFGSRVALADLAGRQTQWTGDRREFLGRHGSLARPAALTGTDALSQRTGPGLDPCGALRTSFALQAHATTEIVFLLGQADTAADAQALITQFRAADLDAVLEAVKAYWDDALGTVQVTTPDRALDLMLNRWLLYQTLVCRMWARSAFYQASGAYGFRDQLQDGMALAITRPALTREHLLRAAARQFAQGDVQHWWLPPTGQGVRTRISDDRVWLAYAAAHYVEITADQAIFDEQVTFLEAAALKPGEHDSFTLPCLADEQATFFEHCARALDDSLALGAHGLPLIGTGDWNDGMNRVGEQGRGESVWLGWFLHATLMNFAPIAQARADTARSARWLAHAAALRTSLEREAWDGAWYRRGFFDDGTPLGSAANDECRIDSIAQSWSVISGAANPLRAAQAMVAVDEQLIRHPDGLALLFAPPFAHTAMEPGYIKSYPPGVRENGGQYTHAAAWSIFAFAKLGLGEHAAQLFTLLNPISHSSTRTALRRYKVEPYVVAADVYSVPPHVGRGGWTWYTGAAGWLYRAGLEAILGFHLQGDYLLLTPCIPATWPRFEIVFKHRAARYQIVVENPAAVCRGVVHAVVDGVALPPGESRLLLQDDAADHQVRITLG